MFRQLRLINVVFKQMGCWPSCAIRQRSPQTFVALRQYSSNSNNQITIDKQDILCPNDYKRLMEIKVEVRYNSQRITWEYSIDFFFLCLFVIYLITVARALHERREGMRSWYGENGAMAIHSVAAIASGTPKRIPILRIEESFATKG